MVDILRRYQGDPFISPRDKVTAKSLVRAYEQDLDRAPAEMLPGAIFF
jgi:hypothetical protein